ncbi:MAG: KGG domain-containing protein [Gemmatimonadaceae bacterium]
MVDRADNQGDRMDERSGRSSGTGNFGSGTIGGNVGAASGNNRGIGGNVGNAAGNNRAVGGNSGTLADTRNGAPADVRNTGTVSRKTPRGFAAMDPQAQRAIAAKGGRAAHQKGTAHEFTSEEARIAGRKGGEASRGGRRSTATNESTA